LDYYLGLPKNALAHVLVSRMGLAGWGDVACAVVAFAVFGPHDPLGIVLYLVLVLTSMVTFVSCMVLAGSLAFFIGNAEAAAFQMEPALITLSLYPGGIYRGWLRIVLFSVLPAGFISHLPVELMRSFDPLRLGAVVAFALGSALLAAGCFRLGLRRYESGNLLTLRG